MVRAPLSGARTADGERGFGVSCAPPRHSEILPLASATSSGGEGIRKAECSRASLSSRKFLYSPPLKIR